MKTIPLQPIFDNAKFQELNPTARYYLLEAIYLLSKLRKLSLPLPTYLRSYFICPGTHYFKYKLVYPEILIEVIPEILKIKNLQRKIVNYPINANIRRGIEKRKKRNKKETFSDELVTHNEIIPTPPLSGINQYHKGKHDHVERAKALAATGNEQVTFTDD